MSSIIRLLKSDGAIDELEVSVVTPYKRLAGETEISTLNAAAIAADPLVIEFNGVADGRGFSLAKEIINNLKYQGKLYAGGYINPDQLSLAFQTGFHGVLVTTERWEDYGQDSWQAALSPIVKLSYAGTDSPALKSIWQMRHGA